MNSYCHYANIYNIHWYICIGTSNHLICHNNYVLIILIYVLNLLIYSNCVNKLMSMIPTLLHNFTSAKSSCYYLIVLLFPNNFLVLNCLKLATHNTL